MHGHPSLAATAPRAVTTITLREGFALPLDDILFVFTAAGWPHTLTPQDWDRYWDILDGYRRAAGRPDFPAPEDYRAILGVLDAPAAGEVH